MHLACKRATSVAYASVFGGINMHLTLSLIYIMYSWCYELVVKHLRVKVVHKQDISSCKSGQNYTSLKCLKKNV